MPQFIGIRRHNLEYCKNRAIVKGHVIPMSRVFARANYNALERMLQ